MSDIHFREKVSFLMEVENSDAHKIKMEILTVFKHLLEKSEIRHDCCLSVFLYMSDYRMLRMRKDEWSPGQEAAFATIVKNNDALLAVHEKTMKDSSFHKKINFQYIYPDYKQFLKDVSKL